MPNKPKPAQKSLDKRLRDSIPSVMRSVFLIAAMSILSATAFASEIREFDLKTIERLGNELTRKSQRPDRGATTPVRKRAKQTAIAALQGKLFNIHYDYVVLNDPDGSGFLVYALGSTRGSRVGFGGSPKRTLFCFPR